MSIEISGTVRRNGNSFLASFNRQKRKEESVEVLFDDNVHYYSPWNEQHQVLSFTGGVKARKLARDAQGRWLPYTQQEIINDT